MSDFAELAATLQKALDAGATEITADITLSSLHRQTRIPLFPFRVTTSFNRDDAAELITWLTAAAR